MKLEFRKQIQRMQEITKSYDVFHSLFTSMGEKLLKAEDLQRAYSIKNLSVNDEKTELEIHIIGEVIAAQYSMIPNEQAGTVLGKIQFSKTNNDTKTSITEMYFDKHTLFKDIKCEDSVCDIENGHFHEHFLLSFMDILLRDLGFI
jgi:hypothetical protein